MTRRVVCALLAASLLAGAARAADDVTAQLRSDVEALVIALMERETVRAEGPSPTAHVNRLVAAGDAKLRPVLDAAWKSVTSPEPDPRLMPAVRQIVLFLYSLAEPGKAASQGDAELVEADGVVRVRRGDPTGGFKFGEGGFGRHRESDGPTPTIALLTKGGKLRKPTKPDARKVLALLDANKVAEEERLAVAQALGESCGANKPALADLVRRFDADPTSPWLMTALAWSGSTDAEPPLRAQVASLAVRVGGGRDAAAPLLATACRALGHLRREALHEEIGKLSGVARDAALAAAGLDVATTLDLAALESAPDAAAKQAIVDSVCRRLVADDMVHPVAGATTMRLVKLLAANLDGASGARRQSLLAAAEQLLYAFNRTKVSFAASGAGGEDCDTKVTGERVGPYPDMATLLASIGHDVESGELLFVDPPGPLGADERPQGEPRALRSNASCPDPARAELALSDLLDVRLEGQLAEDGLHLTLTNVGAAPITVNRAALRCGTAEITQHDCTGGTKPSQSYRQLALQLGFIRADVATPAERLLVLAPRAAHSWVVGVRPEHRNADHISVELTGRIALRGIPAAPPLAAFQETWIK